MSARVRILNGQFDPFTLDGIVDRLIQHIREGKRGWLCTVNVAILMMMRDNRFLQGFVDRSSFVVADGQPLVWAASLSGQHLPSRVAGIDLITALSERAAKEGFGIYLLGARDEVVKKVAESLKKRIPRLDICGVADGYFSDEEAPERARAVAESGARVLFVAMGVPRQERFIDSQWDKLSVQIAIGVGGSFDVLAGLRTRAPQIVQRWGLEWLYRLSQEPRRLAKRYATTNSRFIYLIARSRLTSRKSD